MIDIHCHILPGVDDGAKTFEDSLKMARQALAQGITSIIATPHHQNGSYENNRQAILNKVEELNAALQIESIPIKILAGQEPRLYGDLLVDYEKGQILTLNNMGRYLFIEFPTSHVPRYSKQMLYDIQMNGIIPIIVHPERNSELIQNSDLLYEFVKNGALTQITAASVAGYFGKSIKKFSHQLIESNLTHFVASDAHNVSNRGFKLAEAFDVIDKFFGNDTLFLFNENSHLLIDGKNVIKEMPEKIKRRKIFGFI